MTSRERVKAALACRQTDKVPWIELGNKGLVVEMLLDHPLPVDLENGPSDDQGQVEAYLLSLIEFSQRAGMDAVVLKFWSPVFATSEYTDAGQTIRRVGLVRDRTSLDIFRKYAPKPVTPGSAEYESSKTYQRVMAECDLARGFQVGSIYGFVESSVGFEAMCLGFHDDPDLIKQAAEFAADHVIETARKLCDLVDLDFIVLNDDIAFKTAPMISPDLFRDFFLPHFVRLGQLLAERDVGFVMHTDGGFLPLLDMLLESGIVAIQPCEAAAVDIGEIKARYRQRLCPMGNVDVDLLIRGTPEQVYESTKQLLLTVGREDGYVLSSGNIIMEETPRRNFMAMVQAHKDFADRDGM